ncbi:MAG: four helix bundle protein [Anaerolineae bacterium]|jgi:four helix bundle protein
MEKERFEELRFYQAAMAVLTAAYRLAKKLPDYEKYNLASQLRRAALSTTLNIAEGYGRYHFPDRLRFFYYARGSLFETLGGFVAAHAVGYVNDEQLAWVRKTTSEAAAALNAYIRFIRKQKQGAETFGEKLVHEPGIIYEIISEPPNSTFPDSQIPDCLFPNLETGEDT